MYIRTKEEALEAVSEVLALPERREQIIQSTVAIMRCLEAEARRFLADCQSMLIEDGLEGLKRKRRELLDQLQETEVIVVIDPEEDQQFEAVAAAFDALRFSELVLEVFPELRRRYPNWRVARAVGGNEQAVREALIQGIRLQGSARSTDLAPAMDDLVRYIDRSVPDWVASAPILEALCAEAVAPAAISEEAKGHADDPALVFAVIAMSDDRARAVLDRLASDRDEALQYVDEIRKRLSFLQELQQRADK